MKLFPHLSGVGTDTGQWCLFKVCKVEDNEGEEEEEGDEEEDAKEEEEEEEEEMDML